MGSQSFKWKEVNRICKFYFLFKRLFWSEPWYNKGKAHKWISDNDTVSNNDKRILCLCQELYQHTSPREWRPSSLHFRQLTDTSAEKRGCLKRQTFVQTTRYYVSIGCCLFFPWKQQQGQSEGKTNRQTTITVQGGNHAEGTPETAQGACTSTGWRGFYVPSQIFQVNHI